MNVNGSTGPDTYNFAGTENFFLTTINGSTGGNSVNVFATTVALAINSGGGSLSRTHALSHPPGSPHGLKGMSVFVHAVAAR